MRHWCRFTVFLGAWVLVVGYIAGVYLPAPEAYPRRAKREMHKGMKYHLHEE